jgi:tRNA threonylcarbamoyladenosine biosynthesis protein TsaE
MWRVRARPLQTFARTPDTLVQPYHHLVPALAPRARVAMTRDELVAWGEALGRAVSPPLVVALAGDLGAGKTTLAQAMCRGYGVTEPVTSPTFALVHRYDAARSPVYHLDLYRIERPSELVNIGWDEIAMSHALVIVEWPERAGDLIPAGHVPIDLEHVASDPDRRVLLAG